MKMIDEVHKQGGKIKSFYSYCELCMPKRCKIKVLTFTRWWLACTRLVHTFVGRPPNLCSITREARTYDLMQNRPTTHSGTSSPGVAAVSSWRSVILLSSGRTAKLSRCLVTSSWRAQNPTTYTLATILLPMPTETPHLTKSVTISTKLRM